MALCNSAVQVVRDFSFFLKRLLTTERMHILATIISSVHFPIIYLYHLRWRQILLFDEGSQNVICEFRNIIGSNQLQMKKTPQRKSIRYESSNLWKCHLDDSKLDWVISWNTVTTVPQCYDEWISDNLQPANCHTKKWLTANQP